MAVKVYILDKDRQVVEATLAQWSAFLRSHDRVVGVWSLGDVTVSTAFIGVDHRVWSEGPPLLFETMVFGGLMDQHQERCSTWAEAEAQHERVCAEVRAKVLQ